MTLWLFLHIAGCVLFLGNIITAAFWKVRADLKGDPADANGNMGLKKCSPPRPQVHI